MKQTKLRLLCAALAALLLLGLAGCASSSKVYSSADNAMMEAIEATTMPAASGEIMGGTVDSAEAVSANRKIIETYQLRVETLEFDALLEKVTAKTKEIGGYIESSSVDNSGYTRSAQMTIRVPHQQGEAFSGYLSENSHVLSSGIDTTDITLTYVDTKSRVDAYKAEKEQLEALMKQAKDLTEILSIQNRLTEVIYEIESYESQLRTYDNLVDYATVNLHIREVEKETVVEKLSVWEQIGHNLTRGFENVGAFLTALFIVCVSALPYLLVVLGFAAVVLVIVLVCTRISRRRRKDPPTQSERKHE